MKINSLIFLVLTILSFNGCATHKMELTAVASPDQKTDPYGAVVSEKMHMVSMSPYKEIPFMEDNAIFNIILENGGKEPLIIDNENISVIFEGHDKKHTIKKLDVLYRAELMQDVQYTYKKMQISYLSRIGRENDRISATSLEGPDAEVFFDRIFSLKNHGLYHLIWGVEEAHRRLKKLKETFPDLILNQKTIMPRESITALISCRTNEIPLGITGDFKINVSIDGEEHLFTFTRR